MCYVFGFNSLFWRWTPVKTEPIGYTDRRINNLQADYYKKKTISWKFSIKLCIKILRSRCHIEILTSVYNINKNTFGTRALGPQITTEIVLNEVSKINLKDIQY